MTSLQRAKGEYNTWFGSGGPKGLSARLLFGPFGLWLASTPLVRLPEELHLDSTMVHLDIGCGAGALVKHLNSRVGATLPSVGVDLSHNALRLAGSDDNTNRYVEASGTNLPFATNTFSLVTAGYVIKHLDDPDLLLLFSEIHRVLAPGGLMVVWEFGPSNSKLLNRWNSRVLSRYVSPPRLRPINTLIDLAKNSGFEYVDNAGLRPFLLPPIPRVSMIGGKPPDGYVMPENTSSLKN